MVPIADMRSFRIFRQLLLPDSYLRRATATNLIATHARIYWAGGIFYAFFCHAQGFDHAKPQVDYQNAIY
jgi:hypothetical protein